MELETAAPGIVKYPKVIHGRLHFDDEVHLRSYYNYLENQIKRVSERDTLNLQEILQENERTLGFISARSHTDFIDMSIGDRGGSSCFLYNWLLDPIRLSLMNEFYEWEVGDYTYIYFSPNQIYQVLTNDTHTIEVARTLVKGNDDYYPKLIWPNSILLSHVLKLTTLMDERGGGTGPYECKYIRYPLLKSFPCEPLRKKLTTDIRVAYKAINQEGQTETIEADDAEPLLYQVIIHWGDGTDDYVSPLGVEEMEIEHVFPQLGLFNGTIKYVFYDYCNPIQTIIEIIDNNEFNVSGACWQGELDIVQHDELNNKRMTSELWVKHDMFGEHQVATTRSYEWQHHWGSWDWHEEDAYTLVDLNWAFHNNDGECSYAPPYTPGGNTGLETDWCSSCQYKRAAMTNAMDHELAILDDEVHSYHKVVNEGNVIERTLILSPCN